MKNIEICKKIKQVDGKGEPFYASIPNKFPVEGVFEVSQNTILKAGIADRLIGKLDGITYTLPNIDFFIKMYTIKDATSSAQIEGTKATMVDAIEMNEGINTTNTDADDILYYLKALKYGTKRINDLPLSLRFIRELHQELMTGARSTHFAYPGEFRRSQNWIGGTNPNNASFVPPPVKEMNVALIDLELFLHNNKSVIPLIHIALAHAQFETIHPFTDGNGRTGRLLITFLLKKENLIERPVLFLSSYFKKFQKVYYDYLNAYHDGKVEEWINFFLDGVIDTAEEAINVSKEIRRIRDSDMAKIQLLAKRESASTMKVLINLFGTPIVTTKTVMKWTGFSRPGAQKLIDRLIDLDILEARKDEILYDKKYDYKNYLTIFTR